MKKLVFLATFLGMLFSSAIIAADSKLVDSDSLTSYYFGDLPFLELVKSRPVNSREGFQFFLLDYSSITVLTCLKDHIFPKERWKLMIKSGILPAPPRFRTNEKFDKLMGFTGKIFVTYVDPLSEELAEKEVFNILKNLLQFNQKVSRDFLENENIDVDPRGIVKMKILINNNLNGDVSLLKGTYYGMIDTKRGPSFELYENSLKKLMTAAGFTR